MEKTEKRLQFIESLLAVKGVSKRELARRMGMSPQNLFIYFQRDDMRLSVAQAAAAELGCDLTFALEREEASTSPLVMDIESLVGQNGLTRLAFLRVAFSMYGISRKDVAEKLGLNYTGVNRWFRVDDIAINYIFKIADCYGLKVRPIIKTKQTEAI